MKVDTSIKSIIEQARFASPVSINSSIINIDNDLYFIVDRLGKRYVLREGKRVREKDIDFEIRLIKLLRKHNFSTPDIKPFPDGSLYLLTKGNWYQSLFFDYIDGKQYSFKDIEKSKINLIDLAGELLGKLHSIANLEKIAIGTNHSRNIFTEFDRLLNLSSDKLNNVEGYNYFLSLLKYFKNESTLWINNNSNRLGAIHNDYGLQNIIFTKQDSGFVIDLDWACYGPFIKDVGKAIALMGFSEDNAELHNEIVQTFIKGYNRTAPFKVEYNKELIFWACYSTLSDACTFLLE